MGHGNAAAFCISDDATCGVGLRKRAGSNAKFWAKTREEHTLINAQSKVAGADPFIKVHQRYCTSHNQTVILIHHMGFRVFKLNFSASYRCGVTQ